MRRTLLPFLLLAASVLPAASQPSPYRQSRAVIVGLDAYRDGESRTGAAGGARAVRDLLVGSFGFDPDRTVLLLDEEATLDRLLRRLADLHDAAPDDRVVVFLAGRGATIELEDGGHRGFFLPHDARTETRTDHYATALSMQRLRQLVDLVPARDVLLLVDAAVGGLTALPPGAQPDATAPPRARPVLVAGGPGETLGASAQAPYSPFVEALLHGLGAARADADGDGTIASDELAAYVVASVPVQTGGALHPYARAFAAGDREVRFAAPVPPLDLPALPERPAPPPRPSIALAVTSVPEGAAVYADGRLLGRTPLRLEHAAPGEQLLRVSHPGRADWHQYVHLRPGSRHALHAELEPNEGLLVLEHLPPGAKVRVDGEPVETTPGAATLRLPVGRYVVEVHRPDGPPLRGEVRVAPGRSRRMAPRYGAFTSEALVRSIAFPGWGQASDGAALKGGALVGAGAGAAVFGLLATARYADRLDAYHAAHEAYRQAADEVEAVRLRDEMTARHAALGRANRLREAALGAILGVYGLNLLDVLLFHSRTDRLEPARADAPWLVRAGPSADGPGLAFRLTF